MVEPAAVTPSEDKTTDSIPRATVEQVLETMLVISRSGEASFDDVRRRLHAKSQRQAPSSGEAMWTVARDVLSDLQRLGFAKIGTLPRKRSEVERLRGSPCSLTETGRSLADLYFERKGRAFDALLLAWAAGHPYFRAFIARLTQGPLFVPDVTSAKQIHIERRGDVGLPDRITKSCIERREAAGRPLAKTDTFARVVREKAAALQARANVADLDPKKLVDAVQDNIVLPAFLASENLPFDAVTFQHLVRVSQDFLCASASSSYPGFDGRVVFATCGFRPDPSSDGPIVEILHHGKTYASPLFKPALLENYGRLATQSDYVNAYALRALVCVQLSAPPRVFAMCFEEIQSAAAVSGLTVYTELPFSPPPPGEQYVTVFNRRIELIKLVSETGA